MKEQLIAPCGMNCNVCSSNLARKYDLNRQGFRINYCTGCRDRGLNCRYKGLGCDLLMNGKIDSCIDCKDYPCEKIKKLGKNYKKKYRLSMTDNLDYIKEHGMKKFLSRERKKWKCQCGGMISCHHGICFRCGIEKLENRKSSSGWIKTGWAEDSVNLEID